MISTEFGTLHMEFAYLSDVTGDPKYKEAVEKVRAVIKDAERPKVILLSSIILCTTCTKRWKFHQTGLEMVFMFIT